MTAFRRAYLAIAAISLASSVMAQSPVAPKVEGAWARPTVNGQAGGGAFLTLIGTTQADRLVSVTANVAKSVELHRMEMDGNTMRMREVNGIEVPAGQTVQLKPGGLHIMFVGLTQTLKNGATIPLTLRFEKGGEVKVNMKVMNQTALDAAGLGEAKR
jgi:periplasmic copper chaperone A